MPRCRVWPSTHSVLAWQLIISSHCTSCVNAALLSQHHMYACMSTNRACALLLQRMPRTQLPSRSAAAPGVYWHAQPAWYIMPPTCCAFSPAANVFQVHDCWPGINLNVPGLAWQANCGSQSQALIVSGQCCTVMVRNLSVHACMSANMAFAVPRR